MTQARAWDTAPRKATWDGGDAPLCLGRTSKAIRAALRMEFKLTAYRHRMRRLVRVLRTNGKRCKHKINKKSAYCHKGLLIEIFRKEAESQNNRKPECYNNAAMGKTTYSIIHNEDEEIGVAHTDLDEESTMNFLMETDAYLYSVAEWDNEEDEIVERLNGQEWLDQKTEMWRCLK